MNNIDKKPRLFFLLKIFISLLFFKFNISVAKEFAIHIDKTRVIYYEGDRLQSIGITNKKDYPILFKAKINPENEKDNTKFIITPPILKLEPSQQVSLNVINRKPILDDKIEHLSYICVKGLPPEDIAKDAKKRQDSVGLEINILVKICQKLIYRPSSIAKKPRDIGSYLKWSIDKNKLKSENPTPYYIIFHNLNVDGVKIDTQKYIKPYGYTHFDSVKIKQGKVSWSVIEDYGGSSANFSYHLK